MMLFDYNRLLKKFEPQIKIYAQRLCFNDCDDYCQEIRIYIFNTIDRFDPEKSSLRYYIQMLILTSYRKLIYDQKRQEVFENSFNRIVEDVPYVKVEDNFDEVLSRILQKLDSELTIAVLYGIIYSEDKSSYTSIAKFLNIRYILFLHHVQMIREATIIILKEMEDERKEEGF